MYSTVKYDAASCMFHIIYNADDVMPS